MGHVVRTDKDKMIDVSENECARHRGRDEPAAHPPRRPRQRKPDQGSGQDDHVYEQIRRG